MNSTLGNNSCLFCDIANDRIVAENEHTFAIWDEFPVTKHHALIIPKRHVDEYFGLNQDELLSSDLLLRIVRKMVLKADNTVEGFNIGINSGAVAGQSIFHCHIHLIPRRKGDVDHPKGGVRHLIPGKGNY